MFVILAVESSTLDASVALLDGGGGTLAEDRWQTSRHHADELIPAIRRLTVGSGIPLHAISLYAVGTGPGNFTGLRTSVAAVQALALPSKTPVTGVCSADATAFAIRRDQQTTAPVLIVGDARRERLWTVLCQGGGIDRDHTETDVIGFAEAAALMTPPGLIIASPDWSRLETILEPMAPSSAFLIRNNQTPTATDVGRLAYQRMQAGFLSAPPEPIYVHPPVFIDPVFTESSKRRIAPTP